MIKYPIIDGNVLQMEYSRTGPASKKKEWRQTGDNIMGLVTDPELSKAFGSHMGPREDNDSIFIFRG